MDVELPTTGCNVINSSTTFYNYSPDGRTRESYVIYDGKALLASSQYSQYGFSYTGTCLHTGDLVYSPEIQITFRFYSFIVVLVALILLYKVIFKRLIP